MRYDAHMAKLGGVGVGAGEEFSVIIGGTVGSFMSDYIKDLRKKAIQLNPFEKNGDYILCCHYRTEASAVGAAAH